MRHCLEIDTHFARLIPHFQMAMVEANVVNSPFDPLLQQEIARAVGRIVLDVPLEEIKNLPAIQHTREAYKRLGKDPNRYRPAAEQLHRRIVRGLGLYTINTLVDFGNLVSLATGFSIGVFDADLVMPQVTLRRGEADDPFEAIGRGVLNVEGLPLYLDQEGPFATPTSDAERTKVLPTTSKALVFINSYIASEEEAQSRLQEAVSMLAEGLKRYLLATEIETAFFRAEKV